MPGARRLSRARPAHEAEFDAFDDPPGGVRQDSASERWLACADDHLAAFTPPVARREIVGESLNLSELSEPVHAYKARTDADICPIYGNAIIHTIFDMPPSLHPAAEAGIPGPHDRLGARRALRRRRGQPSSSTEVYRHFLT
jgi:hypothetical protein